MAKNKKTILEELGLTDSSTRSDKLLKLNDFAVIRDDEKNLILESSVKTLPTVVKNQASNVKERMHGIVTDENKGTIALINKRNVLINEILQDFDKMIMNRVIQTPAHNQIYATDSSGVQTTIEYTSQPNRNTIVMRDQDGYGYFSYICVDGIYINDLLFDDNTLKNLNDLYLKKDDFVTLNKYQSISGHKAFENRVDFKNTTVFSGNETFAGDNITKFDKTVDFNKRVNLYGDVFVGKTPSNIHHIVNKQYVDNVKNDLDAKIQNTIEIAQGKTKTYIIATGLLMPSENSCNDYFSSQKQILDGMLENPVLDLLDGTTINVTDLKVGDIILLLNEEFPDRYVISISVENNDMVYFRFGILETRKIDLEPYATTKYVDEVIASLNLYDYTYTTNPYVEGAVLYLENVSVEDNILKIKNGSVENNTLYL